MGLGSDSLRLLREFGSAGQLDCRLSRESYTRVTLGEAREAFLDQGDGSKRPTLAERTLTCDLKC